MKKPSILLLVSALLLSGCASTTLNSKKVDHADIKPATPTQAAALPSQENIPNVELTDEIFFGIESSEIAFQRGQFILAFNTMMTLAEQTRDPRLAKRALEMALLVKEAQPAKEAAQLWHDISPNSDEATQYYWGFLVLEEDWATLKTSAAERLAQASKEERSLTLMRLQRLLARAKDKQAAWTVLETLCQPYLDTLEAHIVLSQASFANNDKERASAEAQLALKLDSTSQLAVVLLASASPSPDQALHVLAEFLAHNPKAHEVRRAYAGLLIEQKQFDKAQTQLEQLLKDKPDDPSLLYALGVLALEMKDLAKAEKDLLAFVKLTEANPNEQRDATAAYLYLSQIADDKKDGVAAIAWLDKIQSYDNKNAAYFNAQLRRAVLIAKYRSLEEAQQFLSELKTSQAENIDVIQLNAQLLRNSNRISDAFDVLSKGLEQYPSDPDLLYDYAMTAEKLGRVDDAESALQALIKVSPNNQQAYNALGYLWVDRNIRLTDARTLIEKALSLAPNDAYILDSMGWLEFKERHYEIALAFLQRAYKVSQDVEIAAHLGEVLWVMGEQRQAKAIWKEAQQKDAANATLTNTLKRLNVNL